MLAPLFVTTALLMAPALEEPWGCGETFMVTQGNNHVFGLGSRDQGTERKTLKTALYGRSLSGPGTVWACGSEYGIDSATDSEQFYTTNELQIAASTSQASGVTLQVNTAQTTGPGLSTTLNATGIIGGEIGRYAWQANSHSEFYLYELAIYTTALTPEQMDEVVTQMMADHGVIATPNVFVMEGDSITQGTGTTDALEGPCMILSEPGRNLIPAGWRIRNSGTSGDNVLGIVAELTETNSWPNKPLPGRSVAAVEIGRNDWSNRTALAIYGDIVAYVTGLLTRGWEVRVMVNMSSGSALEAVRLAQVAMLTDTVTFFGDLDAGVGDTYDGKVSLVSTNLIEHDGRGRIWETSPPDPDYIQGDSTHPNQLGALVRLTGGTTPQYGIAYNLV